MWLSIRPVFYTSLKYFDCQEMYTVVRAAEHTQTQFKIMCVASPCAHIDEYIYISRQNNLVHVETANIYYHEGESNVKTKNRESLSWFIILGELRWV